MADTRATLRQALRRALSKGTLGHVRFARAETAPPLYAFAVNFPTVVLVLEGSYEVELSCQGRTVLSSLRAGQALYAGPNCWYRPTWRTRNQTLTVLFGRKQTGFSLVRARPSPHGAPVLAVSKYHTAPPPGHLSRELLDLCGQVQRPGTEGALAVHLVQALLLSCDDLLEEGLRPTGSRARQSFDGICSYVQEHFQEPLTRRSVAAEFGVTPNHLSRLFRAEGLMRFWEYVTWVRIDRAKWMLAHYDIPVKEVAMRCGFEESSYFCQVFRRRAKLTPVEYRLKYQRRPHP